jgi:hypothetical protein
VADEAFSSTRNIPRSDLLPDDLKTASAMKMIGWNCQGKGKNLRSSNKMEFLDGLMLSTDAQIVGIWVWALVHDPIQILKFSWPIHA